MDRILTRLLPDSMHQQADRDLAYRTMHLCAELLLTQGHRVVLDATYGRRVHRIELERICSNVHCDLFLIECRVPVEIAVARFQERGSHPASDLDDCRVARLAAKFDYTGLGLIVDTMESETTSLGKIHSYLAQDKSVDFGNWPRALLHKESKKEKP